MRSNTSRLQTTMYEHEREQEETQEDLLSASFERSATAVRRSFGRFEGDIVRPTVRYVLVSFMEHPIRSAFLATYAALSALPILSFAGFSVFVFSSFVFLALCAALLAWFSVVLFLGFWLGCTLVFLFFLSIPITAGALGAYLLLRFAFIARREGAVGPALSQWAREAKGQFYNTPPAEDKEDGRTEPLMVGSVVLDAPQGEKGPETEVEDAAQTDALSPAESVKVEGSP
ncbi:hypothetical protein BD413DRAFT_564561 [Trametes elegans]|nr:hypothetical protein BD413DRAFT_564561 [Trametes elegans]